MTANPSIPAAFIAGLLSFLSPCVLPLISSWLIILGGKAAGTSGSASEPVSAADSGFPGRSYLILSTISFILGFSSTFIALSLLLSGFFMLLGSINALLNSIAGIIIILFGLNMLIPFIPFLNYEKRLRLGNPRAFSGSFVLGLAFGAGWTPCIGPILGSILLMASQSGDFLFSAVCLAAYSAGLGLPFLMAAFFWGFFMKKIHPLRSFMPWIQKISGVFIIGIGIFVMLGRFKTLSGLFLRAGYILVDLNGNPAAAAAPVLMFSLIALLPLFVRLIQRKPPFSRGSVLFSGFFLLLALFQAAGLINCLDILSRWFMYIGI
jgi:cytochrome c-type biogenesis protein